MSLFIMSAFSKAIVSHFLFVQVLPFTYPLNHKEHVYPNTANMPNLRWLDGLTAKTVKPEMSCSIPRPYNPTVSGRHTKLQVIHLWAKRFYNCFRQVRRAISVMGLS